jgi:hypothetical protein
MVDANVKTLLDCGNAVGVVDTERCDTSDRPAAECDGGNHQPTVTERSARILEFFTSHFFNHEGHQEHKDHKSNSLSFVFFVLFVVNSLFQEGGGWEQSNNNRPGIHRGWGRICPRQGAAANPTFVLRPARESCARIEDACRLLPRGSC